MEKDSTQPLKEKVVEDKEELVGVELKAMVLMMKEKEKEVKEEREGDDSIVDSSDDEAHDPVQPVVAVKEVPTAKPVEMMVLPTVGKGRIDLDAPTDLLDSVVKEEAEEEEEEEEAEGHVTVNSVGKEEAAVEAVDEAVTVDHEEEVAKKVAKEKGRNR